MFNQIKSNPDLISQIESWILENHEVDPMGLQGYRAIELLFGPWFQSESFNIDYLPTKSNPVFVFVDFF